MARKEEWLSQLLMWLKILSLLRNCNSMRKRLIEVLLVEETVISGHLVNPFASTRDASMGDQVTWTQLSSIYLEMQSIHPKYI